MRDAFIRATRPSQWPILSQVAATKQIGKSEDCLELLDNLAVLEYRDGAGPWYDVNPVVREAQEFFTA